VKHPVNVLFIPLKHKKQVINVKIHNQELSTNGMGGLLSLIEIIKLSVVIYFQKYIVFVYNNYYYRRETITDSLGN